MIAPTSIEAVALERQRILAEYRRREKTTPPDLYAPWQPANLLMVTERRRLAAQMLHEAGVFPGPGHQCLEIGCGALGWLGELIAWGVREVDLHGIELDRTRGEQAQAVLPMAEILIGDATDLPWISHKFKLVVVSTVFTSILNQDVRRMVADEITRVLAPGGALLWYDCAVNNPRNPNLSKVHRSELVRLFPKLKGKIRTVTLAPPLARLVAPRNWLLASLLGSVPLLRTHLLAVLIKSP
jgi:SAM-dependent methyltransferase